jgi:hypothetical protein
MMYDIGNTEFPTASVPPLTLAHKIEVRYRQRLLMGFHAAAVPFKHNRPAHLSCAQAI